MKLPSYLFLSRHHIYNFRRRTPDNLKGLLPPEIRISLRTRDRASAVRLARILTTETDSFFAHLYNALRCGNEHLNNFSLKPRLQTLLRMTSDLSPIKPLHIESFANSSGISTQAILNAVLSEKAAIFVFAQNWPCWAVENVWEIERDYDGSFITDSIEAKGVQTQANGFRAPLDTTAILVSILERGEALVSALRQGHNGALFLAFGQAKTVCASDLYAETPTLQKIVAALPAPTSSQAASSSTFHTDLAQSVAGQLIPIIDPIGAKHGSKRFSELFAAYIASKKRDGKFKEEARMTTEARVFEELMENPRLSEIDSDMIKRFADLLRQMPVDLNHAKRHHKTSNYVELIKVAQREQLKTKSEDTVKRHVGRVGQIFSWATQDKVQMLKLNPAANYSSRRGTASDQKRDQDARERFSKEDLVRIFAAEWFSTGQMGIRKSGVAEFRPHYYWLPLLALFTGGRLNELSQIYLKDIAQAKDEDTGKSVDCWYLDMNLEGADKTDSDEPDIDSDKSLKTVNALRAIPLHPQLINLGLIEYASQLQKHGYNRLFPELKHDRLKGYGKAAGKWFNDKFLGRELGIPRNGKKVFHSFRHNFTDNLKKLHISEEIRAQLNGHKRGETESGDRYSKDFAAMELLPFVSQLRTDAISSVFKFNAQEGIKAVQYAINLKRK